MRSRRSTGRGRPRGRYYSRVDIGLLEYLAGLAYKHGINAREFFSKLVDAWKNQESACNSLTIKCRNKTRDSATFLITSSYKVIAQFSIPERILRENNPLKDYAPPKSREIISKSAVKKIKELDAGMKRINIKARVLEIPEPKLVYTKFGTQAYVSNALIADETGTIRLSLWNKQINSVSVNDVVKIENAKVATFSGKRQLRLERSGKLSVVEGNDFPPIDELKKN